MKAVTFSFLLSLTLATLAQADPLLFNRGLPSSVNANSNVSANRSNVDWGNVDGFINGDDFTASDNWHVSSISVWMVGNPADFGAASFTLYGGVAGGSTFGAINVALPTIAQVYYQPANAAVNCNTASGVSYQGFSSSTNCSPIYQLDFAVNLNLASGTVFNFAPDASPNSASTCVDGGDTSGCFYVHATNALLAGTFQEGSDNKYINFDSTNTVDGDPEVRDSNGNGWDKSSDINVQVYGTVVPEPSTAALIVVGIGALLVRRRKR